MTTIADRVRRVFGGQTVKALCVVGPDGPAAVVPGSSNHLGYQRFGVDSATVPPSIPAGTTHIRVQAETQNVRWRWDGATNAPTATSGMILYNGQPETVINADATALANFRFIGVAAGGFVNVTYCG